MINRMNRLREIMVQTWPVRLYQWILIWAMLLILVFGGIYGTVVYVDDQSEAVQRSADQALYENSRTELLRCEQRVESRSQIRGAFIDVYEILDQVAPGNSFTGPARDRLESTYPELTLASCPPLLVPVAD